MVDFIIKLGHLRIATRPRSTKKEKINNDLIRTPDCEKKIFFIHNMHNKQFKVKNKMISKR